MKADTIGTIVIIGIAGVGAYFLYTKFNEIGKGLSDALSGVGGALAAPFNFVLNIPAAVNNWSSSFQMTPEQKAAFEETKPEKVVEKVQNFYNINPSGNSFAKAGGGFVYSSKNGFTLLPTTTKTITGAQVGTYISGAPIYAAPSLPAVAAAVQNTQAGFINYKPDVKASLGSSATYSVVKFPVSTPQPTQYTALKTIGTGVPNPFYVAPLSVSAIQSYVSSGGKFSIAK